MALENFLKKNIKNTIVGIVTALSMSSENAPVSAQTVNNETLINKPAISGPVIPGNDKIESVKEIKTTIINREGIETTLTKEEARDKIELFLKWVIADIESRQYSKSKMTKDGIDLFREQFYESALNGLRLPNGEIITVDLLDPSFRAPFHGEWMEKADTNKNGYLSSEEIAKDYLRSFPDTNK